MTHSELKDILAKLYMPTPYGRMVGGIDKVRNPETKQRIERVAAEIAERWSSECPNCSGTIKAFGTDDTNESNT